MIAKLKQLIISYVYIISNQPVKLTELLMANELFNEGMHLDGKRLGFRLKLGRAYLVFLLLVNLFMLPLALITHGLFQMADCHLSIVITIFVTGVIFASFGLFKDWLSDEVALTRIKRMWTLHFPLFDYNEYNEEVNSLYIQSQREGIKQQDLERYILNKLSEE
jgi:hypothetical protein